MAGYRPKSLNELNDMYDKTITAEKAIIKASKQLHDATQSIVPSETQSAPQELPKEESKVIEEFAGEVDSLINRFRTETTAPQTKKESPSAVKEDAPKTEPPKKISFEKEPKATTKNTPAPTVIPSGAKAKPVYSLGTPDEVIEKAAAKSDERSELFDDYMKIMNDDDDDFFSKHESFRKRDKKKKHKKGFFFRNEPKTDDTDEAKAPETIEAPESAELTEEATAAESELPVREVIYTPEETGNSQGFRIEFDASAEAQTEDTEENEEFSDFSDEFAPAAESVSEEAILPFAEEAEEEAEEIEEPTEEHPDFDVFTEEKEEDFPVVPEEIAESTYEDYMNSSEDIFSFDPNKVNTIPEYARDEYVSDEEEEDDEEYYEDEDGYGYAEIGEMPKNKKGIVAGRVLLGILFAILLVFDFAVVGINSVLSVNTGKTILGNKCVFTAETDFVNAGILEGDLVITEQRYAEDGEAFAYINYTQQRFMFGKRSGNIINDIGSELYIAENDGERVLVLRDDTRGVVSTTYPSIGKIVSVCADNFILLLAVSLIIQLVIVLLLAFVLKDKEKAYKKMMKKMIRKGVISAEDEPEYEYTEEEESEAENLFSSIE